MLGTASDLAQSPTDGILGHLPAIFLVAFVLGFAIFATFSMRGGIARRNAERPPARAPAGRDLAAELYDTAARLAAELDDKARRLERLIEDADRRIETLRLASPPPAPSPAPARPAGFEADSTTREIYEQADAGHTAVEIAQQLDEQIGKVELILALRR